MVHAEIDMVINLGWVKDKKYDWVERDSCIETTMWKQNLKSNCRDLSVDNRRKSKNVRDSYFVRR